MTAAGIGVLLQRATPPPPPSGTAVSHTSGEAENKKGSQQDVEQLRKELNARLKLIEDALARMEQREQQRELQRKLASYKDPLEEIRRQKDETALMIVFYADKNTTSST
jgi:Skp family chaperone for outer membrane proteins